MFIFIILKQQIYLSWSFQGCPGNFIFVECRGVSAIVGCIAATASHRIQYIIVSYLVKSVQSADVSGRLADLVVGSHERVCKNANARTSHCMQKGGLGAGI